MYNILRVVVTFLVCKVLFRVKYENLEILEKYDKCMLCANHSRVFDPIFIFPKVENMYSVAKDDLFKRKIIGKIITHFNAIPIKRGSIDTSGSKRIKELLETKEHIRLLIFPEGGIYKENYKENKRKTRCGAVHFSAQTNVPIIPIYITSRPKFFSKVTVTFGDEVIIPNENVLKDKKELKNEAQKLINTIYDIGKKKYRNL